MTLREHWQGVSLAGNYTLEEWLGGDGTTAYFQASLPQGRAVVKLVAESAGDGDAPLDLWHRIRQLRHPNLIELLDFGSAEHGGETVYYAVFESPDDTLASALTHAPLDAQDSREVLDAAIDALRYLHAQGLVIGALDPERVVAVGDRIKLSTDAIREAEPSSAYREDVRLLGDFWRQALLAASPRSEEIAAHASDANAQTRWTLAEIHAALNPPMPPIAAPPPPVSPSVPEPPISESPVSMRPAGAPEHAPLLPPSRRTPPPAPTFRFPRWILVGTGAFLLLIFALNRPRHADVATEPRVTPPAATTDGPVPMPPRSSAPNPTPPTPSRPVPSSPAPATPGTSAPAREIWRVIAFTFRTHDAAAKKAEQINRNHPGLNASVFSPKGQRGYYLVALGGRMTHDDAVRLQRNARGKGLPRDLYVQNYSD
jgi:hypothetical protein